MTIKVILISRFPLPYHKNGSWTMMYNYYLKSNCKIDYLICPKPKKELIDVKYRFTDWSIGEKIYYKISNKNKREKIFSLINSVYENNCKYVIQFIDDFGTFMHVAPKLNEINGKNNFYYQFFFHGFFPFYADFQSRKFYSLVNEMVLLTHSSYKVHKQTYTILPCKLSILHNGVDNERFNKISLNEKLELRSNNNIKYDKLIFLWLSRDEPKKGLDFILNVWNSISELKKENSELWIIGSQREFNFKGVVNIGKLPNQELPKYYQMADVYLFPTLCQEGFGLTLIEALHCGCNVIASDYGGVKEVLNNGEYGDLIENPNYSEEWKQKIESYLSKEKEEIENNFDYNKYTLEEWTINLNKLIEDAKTVLKNRI